MNYINRMNLLETVCQSDRFPGENVVGLLVLAFGLSVMAKIRGGDYFNDGTHGLCTKGTPITKQGGIVL